jgi:hypothetical protein
LQLKGKICDISGAKVGYHPLVERLYAVYLGRLANTFMYFCFHTIDCVFSNIRKLTGSGW